MLTIRIHNDGTGDVITGNYDYEVFINNKLIEKGRVTGHARTEGWQALLKQLATESKQYNDLQQYLRVQALLEDNKDEEW